jgi:proline iminopeptidase
MSARRAWTVATALGLAVYALGVRPRMLRFGATDEEVRGPYPGSELMPDGVRGGTMAVTIDAPPSAVWPWLAQMGCDRAGWYSWDRLDNGGVPSSKGIHPEWQEVKAGDRWASTPSGVTWFEVAAAEPERFLALRAPIDMHGGRPFDTASPRPRAYNDTLWCFQLKPLPEERTRLVVSGYAAARPRVLAAVQNFLFWEPAHWIMQTRQFANLKRRAERWPTPRMSTSTGSPSEPAGTSSG